ncbi:Esterase [Dactylellina cionopaga]|nr:Esterase [Dactylellina cionopaga]
MSFQPTAPPSPSKLSEKPRAQKSRSTGFGFKRKARWPRASSFVTVNSNLKDGAEKDPALSIHSSAPTIPPSVVASVETPKKSRSRPRKEKYPSLAEPDRPISVDNPSIFACFMDAAPAALIKALVPRLPLMGKTVAWHALGLSQTSQFWDLKTELMITMIRSFVSLPDPDPLSKSQHVSLKDPGIKGRLWISKVPVPAPTGPETRQYVIDAIDSLIEGDKFDWTKPEIPDASAEWTGYRAGAPKDAPELKIPEEEKYKKMMEEVKSPVTVYYIHGGAMYLMDPATHRLTCARIAKETNGRVLSFRYRLAPQNPFPAALMDCFLGYLYLLYPPPGALHEPVDPKNIVISGDSAGGNLTAALIALILTLRRLNPGGIVHDGRTAELPLPAGIALNSPWVDTTHSFPSIISNKNFDYIPSPDIYPPGGPVFPKCAIWPTEPPRKAIYVEDRLRLHPLVNPAVFKDWSGAPPVLVMCGQELLTDECKFFAKHLQGQGIVVQFEEYQAMPHCFAQLMDWAPVTKKCFGTWCGFISGVVEGKGEEVKSKATKTLVKSLKEEELEWEKVSPYGLEEVIERMKGSVEHGNQFHKMGIQVDQVSAKL